jgi:hypothetical protein
MSEKITVEIVEEILKELYLDGKISKSMVNGEEHYVWINPQSPKAAAPPPPKMTAGKSYNLLKRFDPPIPYNAMRWMSEGYEVTGVKDGGQIVSQFFPLDEKDKALECLHSLDSGHLWLSEATTYTDEDYGVFTGKRKRVNLLSPDAIFPISR